MKLVLRALCVVLLAVLPTHAAVLLSETEWQALKAMARGGGLYQYGAIVPTTCTVGTLFIDIDEPPGQQLLFCSAPDTWQAVTTEDVDTLQLVALRGRTVLDASSQPSCVQVGSSSRVSCTYDDATDGLITETLPPIDTAWRIPYGKKGYVWDVQGSKPIAEIAPNGLAAGSGTVTMQTGQQLITSNFGVEYNESDANPTCSTGNYNTYADTSETRIKHCENGVGYNLVRRGFARKTADETVNNSAAQQNDDHLSFVVAANAFYTVKVQVMYSASQAADLRMNFTLPAGAVGVKTAAHLTSGATACTGTTAQIHTTDITAAFNGIGGAGVGTKCSVTFEGHIKTAGTAGTAQLQWAQSTADATDAVVYTDSWLSWIREE